MPKVEPPVRLSDESGAVDDVCNITDDRLVELGVLRTVVFEVGVLDCDDLGGGLPESDAQRCTLAPG